MATISSISVAPMAKTLNSKRLQQFPVNFSNPKPFHSSVPSLWRPRIHASKSSSSYSVNEEQKRDEESTNINVLQRFINLNLGSWNGSFYQFDGHGNLLHKVSTKLAASSYGEDELISLIQTLYIKKPVSSTSISGSDTEQEWTEYKIKETNMFTVDGYHQIGLFSKEKAFSQRYQTAGMLETVLRQGVLGEDDTGEESPKNLKLPSRWPSVVCENCLFSQEKDMRARAFHILDPKGVLEMLLIFLESKDGVPLPSSLDNSKDSTDRITPFLGRWKGHSITKRSGVYGATITEADTAAILEIDDQGQLIQDFASASRRGDITTNVLWTGTLSGHTVTFDGGFLMTLLPGGMYMGCPCDVAKSVAESKPFHLEFCWVESTGKRQRLIRTFDNEGLAVSSTYIFETKQ